MKRACVSSAWLGIFALLVTACGAAPPVEEPFASMNEARIERARELAPDLHARALRARADMKRAVQEGDSEAAADHRTRARLWMRTALIETERVELDRHRGTLLKNVREARRSAVAAHRERERIEQEVARLRAASVAREQAEKAFEHAAEREERGRRGQAARGRRRQAVAIQIERARSMLAAAKALGARAETLQAARQALEEARRVEDPGSPRAMRAADAAVKAAERLLKETQDESDQLQ